MEIARNFFLTRKSVIYIDKIEMIVLEDDLLLRHFDRCNLLLTFAGNIFTLFGLPRTVAETFCEQLGYNHPAHTTASSPAPKAKQIRISTLDLLKKSLLQTKLIWYLLLVAALWAAVFLMGSEFISSETAHTISSFVFRHIVLAGTLVLSLGLPTVIIWIWALTGGFLVEFLKYYRYTATRKGNILCFEYGLVIHRRVYITADRIAITQFSQTPVMRIFGYGKLMVRAVGYNPYFLKAQPILPFVKLSALPNALENLLPELDHSRRETVRRSLRYDFFSRKWLVPLLCLTLVPVFGWAWLIVALITGAIVSFSILLEYQNTDFVRLERMTLLSKGGFYREAAWIYTDRIELVSATASRRKKRAGFVNLRIKVFGKRGTYALVRNIDAACAEAFGLGDSNQKDQNE